MENIAMCSCGNRQFEIFFDRAECASCHKEYKWITKPIDTTILGRATLARQIVSLINEEDS